MVQMGDDKTVALIDLLRLERDAIRVGDFSTLIEMANQKEILLADLAGTEPGRLAELQTMAAQNQRMLAAALRGVRAAQHRLQAILNASKGFNSYDEAGQVKPIRPDEGSLEYRL